MAMVKLVNGCSTQIFRIGSIGVRVVRLADQG